MRKTVSSLILILMFLLVFPVSGAEETGTYLYIEKSSVQVTVGGYGWLKTGMRNLGPGVRMTSLSWESTDETVVKIGDDSKYTAVGRGKAQLIRRVKTNDGQEYTAVCDVQVVVPVDHLESEVTGIFLVAGRETSLPEIRVLPEEADVRTCTWSVADPQVASVKDGKLAAHMPGKTVLTATCDERIDKHRLGTLSFQVTVTPAVETLSVRGQNGVYRLEAGKREIMPLQITPGGTTPELLHFASSAEDILTVSGDGVMLGLATGKAVVTVWTDQTVSGERLEASLTVEVFRKIERISLRPNPYVAFRGQTVSLTPVISPADADLSSLTVSWQSDNPYSAFVRGDGLTGSVVCSQVGQSTITVRAEDGSRKRGSLHFRVEPTVPVTIREASAERQEGGLNLSLQLKSRMRETTVRETQLHWEARDREGSMLSFGDSPLPVTMQPARRGYGNFRIPEEELPPEAVCLILRVTGVSYPNGSYEIPEEARESLEVPLR